MAPREALIKQMQKLLRQAQWRQGIDFIEPASCSGAGAP
jgi:hypothetical protein